MFPMQPVSGLRRAGHSLPGPRAVHRTVLFLFVLLLALAGISLAQVPTTQAANRQPGGLTPNPATGCQFAILDFHPCIDANGCAVYGIPLKNEGNTAITLHGTVILKGRANTELGRTEIPDTVVPPRSTIVVNGTVCGVTSPDQGPFHVEVTVEGIDRTCDSKHKQQPASYCAPEATNTAAATNTAEATNTAAATNTAEATNTAAATNTVEATNTPTVINTSVVTNTPGATHTPAATTTAEATNTPTATHTMGTATALATATQTATPAETCPPGVPTQIAPPPFTPEPGCSGTPEPGELSGVITDHPTTTSAVFTNHSATCAYPIGLAIYRKFDNNINHQELYDYRLAVIPPGGTLTLEVNNPACAYQADAFWGDLIVSFAGGARYGERRLDDTDGNGHNYCTVHCPTPVPPATNTPIGASATPFQTATSAATETTVAATSTATSTATATVQASPSSSVTQAATASATPTASGTSTAVATASTTATSTCVPATPVHVVTPAFTPAAGCSATPPPGTLSAVITDHPTTTSALFTNHSATCSYPIGLAVYRKLDDTIEHQVLYDYQLAVIPPNSTLELTVNNPPCAYQGDAFWGDLIVSFAGGARYGERRLDDTDGNGTNYCSIPCTTPVVPTNTPAVPTSTATAPATGTVQATVSSTPTSAATGTVVATVSSTPTSQATGTALATATSTPVVPPATGTATATGTVATATVTSTPTITVVPPTNTAPPTQTEAAPSNTPQPTNTSVPTSTATRTPIPPSATSVPPSATPVPPSATPPASATAAPPSATATATVTPGRVVGGPAPSPTATPGGGVLPVPPGGGPAPSPTMTATPGGGVLPAPPVLPPVGAPVPPPAGSAPPPAGGGPITGPQAPVPSGGAAGSPLPPAPGETAPGAPGEQPVSPVGPIASSPSPPAFIEQVLPITGLVRSPYFGVVLALAGLLLAIGVLIRIRSAAHR